MPGRDASMAELATVLQRSIDHPVVDQTGLSGRYDFDLEFLPDDTQFNGALRDVIKPEAARHTSQEFVTFLQEVVGHGKPPQEIHIVVDNLSAHKTSKVEDFLQNHPQVRLHFTPTYSSWLNQVEIWFSRIEREVIARGVFTSVRDLARKLMRYIRAYSQTARPFKWKYSEVRHRVKAC